MSDVELILNALMVGAAAGTTAGVTSAAQSVVVDAYTGLRDLLSRAFVREGRSDAVLEAVEAEPGAWQSDVSEALTIARAGEDPQVLAAAQALLAAADPAGRQAGKYRIGTSTISGGHVGDTINQVTNNLGATGEFHAQVSFGATSIPPAQPGVA
ncbi:hypothetical protein ABZ738_30720 [Micromonospora sp. NPDC047793]|uniref:hypothetical protein n=1 Tax=Micromonospora sp. NPDC047793 TaxID=3154342 RepID=UPI0033E8735E